MPEFDSKGRPIISVVRVIEYHGTPEWIQKTMASSRLPMQGRFVGTAEHPLPEDHFINSGFVVWDVVDEGGEVKRDEKPPIPIPPGSSRIN